MLREEVSILVVDDVDSMKIQIRELLKSFGFRRVTLASNGEQAIKILKTTEIHLILADWHMSPTDGLELLRLVRANEKHRALPFIMITAESTREFVVQAIKSGVDDYLVKPLTIAQIRNKVYGVLLKRQVLV